MFRTWKRRVAALCALWFVCSAGCVSIPPEVATREIAAHELSGHVRFLAQPALGGRAPRSTGSRLARKYIRSRFEAYGLEPWGTSAGFDQPFSLATNVVGVLRGSDPELADDVVLVCAHYDHVGKDYKGGMHPGAADNASGVAALLEAAERLAAGARPRRSIAFAAFDCEEMGLVGAVAFHLRDDFDKKRIAAIVNVDVLGRALLDAIEDTLFVLGTNGRPELLAEIEKGADETGIRVLPFPEHLVGPMGDHAAFLPVEGPVLFFSCGYFHDYHQPTDTPDRIDYADLEQEARVICRTVERLANADRFERGTDLERDGLADLRGLRVVLAELSAERELAGLTEGEAAILAELSAQAGQLVEQGAVSREDGWRFDCGVSSALRAPRIT